MRKLRPSELAFVKEMLKGVPDEERIASSLPDRLVDDMDDGGMGGLTFISSRENRSLGPVLAEKQFADQDGVAVLATLNIDDSGELYELDILKVDFSPLKSFPPSE
ncbi:hypothetical protein G3N95_21365 [Paraburkholderia sp. Tr-20389]|uniref:DUF6984 family protein n=1 Tax=Paraburkholderia sp. Tr-20389 TaxID=2703903 RepID=UPI00198053A9|nr:hypothetical protein [Paraburkholderia sp. Tr-20389]MBN3755507.1 hypothetical protein [Paraburkholderia sp. Tr-20389]